jgi:RimJ/RimL family protein N-acetyltransferase
VDERCCRGGGQGALALNVQVRRAEAADAEPWARVLEIVAEEREWIGTEPPVDVAAAAARVRGWLASDETNLLWVLEHDGRVVGILSLHPTGADRVSSLGMMVLPEVRRRGGGRALLAAAIDHARRAGLRKIELEVFVENARAIAFYASAGFQIEGIRRDRYLRIDGSIRSTLMMALFV